MDIESYIQEAVFGEKEQHKCFYQLMWDNFKEIGYVITDEEGHEVDAIIKAVSLQNLLGEFMYRLYDEVNETGLEDVIDYCQTVGISDDELLDYCEKNEEIDVDEDFETTVKNALDYTSQITADKMLEEFSTYEVFDYMLTATYAFEQDFTFDFEDYEEMQAFVDTNQDQLDQYKEEYISVLHWIEGGMIC